MSEKAGRLPAKEEFSTAIDSSFRAELNDGTDFEMTLVKLDEIVSNEFQENYSLLFRAPVEAPPEQGIYSLEQEILGRMDIFLVPIRKDETGLYYEAVFNHLIRA